MPGTIGEFLKKIQEEQAAKAATNQRKDLPTEIPMIGDKGLTDQYVHRTDEQIAPSRDVFSEAIYNSTNENKVINHDGNDTGFDTLDDATWHDKLFDNDVDGKLLRKTAAIRPIFRGDASKGPEGGTVGEDAQDVRHREESIFGAIPFVGRLASGEAIDNGYYAYKDKNGKYYLKEVKGTEDELNKVGHMVFNAYGAKPFSNSFGTNFYKGLTNTINNTDEMLTNFLEATGDLGEATNNYLTKGEFKSEEGAFDQFAERQRVRNRLRNLSTSFAADDGGLFSGEGFANGLGSGVGSLLQFGSLGRVVGSGTRLASGFMASEKAIKLMSMLGGGAILNTGEAYSIAKQNNLDDEDAATLALAVGGVNTAVEQVLGSNVLNKWLVGGGAKAIPEIVLRETGGKLSQEALDAATPTILKKVTAAINQATKVPVIGQGLEEGLEEGLQGLAQKTGQVFYDKFFADKDATKGNGKFGTSLMDSDTWRDIFADSVLGGVVGSMGGVAVKNHNKSEQDTIIPLVAQGKADQILASVDMMHASGKLTDYQRDTYKQRVQQLDSLMQANAPIFDRLENKDNAAVLKSAALDSVEDEFASHRQIDQYLQQISKINAEPNVSDAVKQDKIAKLNEQIKKEQETLKTKTQRVRDFIPNAEGKIPAVEKLKNPESTVTPEPTEEAKQEVVSNDIADQRAEDLTASDTAKKEAQEEAANELGVPVPEPTPVATLPQESKTKLEEALPRKFKFEGNEFNFDRVEEKDGKWNVVYKDQEGKEHTATASEATLTKAAAQDLYKPTLAAILSKGFTKENPEKRNDMMFSIFPSGDEPTEETETEPTQEEPTPQDKEIEQAAGTKWGPENYERIQTSFQGHPQQAQLEQNVKNWQAEIQSGKNPAIEVHVNTANGKKNYNVIATVNGQKVQVGYLAPTEGKAALSKDASEATRVAHDQITQLKKAIEESEGTPELDYKVTTGIDAGPGKPYTTKTLTELENRKEDGEPTNNKFMFEGKYVIYSQINKKKPDTITGKFEQSDVDRKDFPGDGYVLKVKDPGGNTRFIGLRTKSPLEAEKYEQISKIIDNDLMSDQAKSDALNKLAFIPSANPLWNAKFKVTKGDPYIILNKNGDNDNEEFGRLTIPKNTDFTAENFTKSLTVRLKDKNKKFPVDKLIGELRTQLPADADKETILANLVPSTTENLWTASHVVPTGIKNADPGIKVTEEAQSGEPFVEESKGGEVLNPLALPTEKDILESDPEEGEAAFKISSLEKLQSTDFKQAEENIKRILPEWFGVAPLRNLAKGIYADGSTLGAFFDDCIYLASKSAKGTEYHEAFHGVFRRLITATEQEKLVRLGARTAQITEAKMARFKAERPSLAGKSKSEIFTLMVEEHLADKFMEHMNTKAEKGIFQRAFDYIQKFINWVTGNRESLDGFFHKIDSGAFKNSDVVRQTNDTAQVEAFKLLPKTSAKESDRIVRLITALFMDRKADLIKNKEGSTYYEQYKDMDDETVIRSIINERKAVESTSQADLEKKVSGPAQAAVLGLHIGEDGKVYKNAYLFPKEITEQVNNLVNYFTVNEDVDKEKDTTEDRTTERNDSSEREFDQSPFEIGGFGSVSRDVKAFIGLTTYKDSEGVDQVVDFFTTYSALERTAAGIEDWDQMLGKLAKLADGSPQAKAIYDKILIQSDNFKKKFQQAFSKKKIEYLQVIIDEKTGAYRVFNANRADVGDIQLSRFKAQFDMHSLADQEKNAKAAAELNTELQRSKSVNKKLADDLAKALANVGMDITSEFIVDTMKGENPVYSTNGTDTTRGLTNDLAEILNQIAAGKNPYIDIETDQGAVGRIKSIATADSLFRDDIINSNFQNAEGKSVYTYVLPSHVLATAQDIQEGKLDKKFEDEFYQLNPLIQMKEFDQNILKKIKLTIFNGIREDKDAEGVTFKHIDSKTNLVSQHALFKAGYLAPFVFEAKSSSALIPLPGKKEGAKNGITMAKFYDNGKVSKTALDLLYSFVKQDLITIDNTLDEIENLPLEELIENYHFKSKDGKPVRLKKDDVLETISKGKRSTLPRGFQTVQFPALNGLTNEQLNDEKAVKAELEKYVSEWIKNYKDLLADNDIKVGKGGKDNSLLLTEDDQKNYKSIDDYLGEFLLKDFIFSNAYAQLHRGTEAKYKDAVDITKRAAGQMAAGFPLISERPEFKIAMLSDDKFFINPETMERAETGAEVNATDAQGYVSPKRFKEILKGLGRMSEAAEKQIDALIAGEKIDWDPKLFTANSIKNVYFDGTIYIKTSIFPLFREFTSQKDASGNWIAQDGKERFHSLLEQMENNNIDEIYHESALKLVKKRKNFPNENGLYDKPLMTQTLSNRYWRLQVENPSGKTEIVDGTQLIQLVDSEMDNDHQLEFRGKKMELGHIRHLYQQMLADTRNDSMMKAVDFLDLMVHGKSMFIDKIQDTLAESGTDNNTLEFFEQLAKDSKEFKYSTDLSNINGKFQELFLSHFTKAAFRQKTAGSKFSLVTSSGYKVDGRPLKIHKIEDGKLQYAECIISEEILTSYGITKEEFENNTPKEVQDEILTMLGFRIPTQSHHSMMPFKVVGWLPAYYGSVIIAPAEITYLSGADYDIDSLFVQRKEFKVNSADGKKQASLYDDRKTDKELFDDYIEYEFSHNKDAKKVFKTLLLNDPEYNKLKGSERADAQYAYKLETLKVLGLPDNLKEFSAQKIEKKITNAARYNVMLDTRFAFLNNPKIWESLFTPASLDSLKQIAADVSKVTGKSENSVDPYNLASSRFNHWLNNAVGKANVGSAANANLTSAFLTKHKVDLKGFIEFDGKAYSTFAHNNESDIQFVYDDKGKPIDIEEKPLIRRKADSLSTLVSAMTDNAKERLAAKLNLTMDNLSVFSNMVALGMGLNRSMIFASQPVILTLTKKLVSANSVVRAGESTFGIAERLQGDIAKALGKDNLPEDKQVTSKEMLEYLNFDMNSTDIKGLQFQYKVIGKYIELSGVSKDIAKVTKLLSTNKAIGINFEEFDAIQEAATSISTENFRLDVVEALDNDLNIDQNLKNVYKVDKLLHKYFLARTEGYQKFVESTKDLGIDSKGLNKLYTDLTAFLGMQKLDQKKPIKDYQYLIQGKDDNIVNQRDKVLKDHPELKDNLFLRQLVSRQPDTNQDKNQFYRLEFNGRMKTDPRFIEKLCDSYRELTVHPDEKVREFSKELVRYLLVKDNLKFVNNSFIRLLGPNTLKSYSDTLKEIKTVFDQPIDTTNIFNSQFDKAFKDYYGKSWWTMLTRFQRIWFAQEDNAKKLNQFSKKVPAQAIHREDNTVVINFSGIKTENPTEKVVMDKALSEGFPKFFSEFVKSEYGGFYRVWERDNKHIKSADGKNVGASYTILPTSNKKFQSLYYTEGPIKEEVAQIVEEPKTSVQEVQTEDPALNKAIAKLWVDYSERILKKDPTATPQDLVNYASKHGFQAVKDYINKCK
jgi:hypothetical protein